MTNSKWRLSLGAAELVDDSDLRIARITLNNNGTWHLDGTRINYWCIEAAMKDAEHVAKAIAEKREAAG